MKQEEWKIIYSNYSGIAKRAVNLLSKEAGRLLIREEQIYRLYVLPCEKEGAKVSKNAFFVSLYKDSPTIQRFVSSDEIPQDGFIVKVVKNPDCEDGRLVFLSAHCERELFYSVVSFIDDYMPAYAPPSGANWMQDLIFDRSLQECSYTEVPDHKKRSIFTWGHSTNDFRAYIDNMARLKLNELIIWNDYIPINIDEIIEYAHSYGISVVLGYSWGWREIGNKSAEITEESINKVKEIAISAYRDDYVKTKCDGIYFQSFTERKEESVGGKLISEIATEMANDIAEELWKITPDLRLIWGLHATSVTKHLPQIEKLNEKIEILWEDCGSFPFSYSSRVNDEKEFENTLSFVKEILNLRGGRGVGLAFKSIMMLDWTKVVRQNGPYVMGENHADISSHDRRMRAKAWRRYSSDWMDNGEYAHRLMQFIKENELSDTTMCIAGTLDGGIYLPLALYAQMFRNNNLMFGKILQKVSDRSCVTLN